jgi:hypothetical protein
MYVGMRRTQILFLLPSSRSGERAWKCESEWQEKNSNSSEENAFISPLIPSETLSIFKGREPWLRHSTTPAGAPLGWYKRKYWVLGNPINFELWRSVKGRGVREGILTPLETWTECGRKGLEDVLLWPPQSSQVGGMSNGNGLTSGTAPTVSSIDTSPSQNTSKPPWSSFGGGRGDCVSWKLSISAPWKEQGKLSHALKLIRLSPFLRPILTSVSQQRISASKERNLTLWRAQAQSRRYPTNEVSGFEQKTAFTQRES